MKRKIVRQREIERERDMHTYNTLQKKKHNDRLRQNKETNRQIETGKNTVLVKKPFQI